MTSQTTAPHCRAPARHVLRCIALTAVVVLTACTGGVADSSSGAASPSQRCASTPGGTTCAVRGDRRGSAVIAQVAALKDQYSLNAVVFGAWEGGDPIVTGALGTALPGVPATPADHFRIGNTTESLESTLLLHLVDRKKIRLDDRLSTWFPNLPDASQITVGMLASSTSGYYHYVKDTNFLDAVHADPFRAWTPGELVAVGTPPNHPMVFPPGTSWSFSDTGFVLLGEILAEVGHAPVAEQIQRMVLGPLGMSHTQMTTTSATPSPVLHGYTGERGVWEDDTFWNPSWATYTGDMTSDLADMGRWARAVGTGSLLSARSRALQFAPKTVGLGPLTPKFYYGLGAVVTNGWLLGGAPGLEGYSGVVAYLPAKKLSVVVFTTTTARSPSGVAFAPAIFNRVGALLDPSQPPDFPNLGG